MSLFRLEEITISMLKKKILKFTVQLLEKNQLAEWWEAAGLMPEV